MARDKCDEEFMYYIAENQVYEHRINNHDWLQVFGATNRPKEIQARIPYFSHQPYKRKKHKEDGREEQTKE